MIFVSPEIAQLTEANVIDDRIDELCKMTTKAHVLNALHACRQGHLLGRNNSFKWRNAYALVSQNAVDFARVDLSWLKEQYIAEGS